MILNLSRKAQREAQARILRHTWFNSFGATLTMMSLIPLLALHYGASDVVMGLIYAAVYVTGLAALVAPLLLNGGETTAIWRKAWLLRALASFAYLALPILPSSEWKVVGLLAVYYVFLILRAVGASASYVATKAVCPARTMQSYMARNLIRHFLSALPASALAFAVLELDLMPSEESGFMLALGIGAVANFVSARILYGLPITGYLSEGSMAGLKKAFQITFGNASTREVAVFMLFQTILAISLMYEINYMKKVAGFSSSLLFLITAVSMVAAIPGMQLLRVAGDYLPFRALMFSAHFVLFVMGLCWTWIEAIPRGGSVFVLGLLYVISFMALTLSGTVLSRLQAVRLPDSHAFEVSMVFQVVTVVSAIIATGLIAATAPLVGNAGHSLVHPYSHAFVIMAFMSMAICVLSVVVRTGIQLGFRQDLGALTPANLLTIYRVHRAEQQTEPESRQLMMEGAMITPTRMSRQMILRWTRSADTTERYRAYRLLNRQPDPEAFDTVLMEAQSKDAPLRTEAITTLGFLKDPRAVPPLREMVAEEDAAVRAMALKSLLRLWEDVDRETILQVYDEAGNNTTRLHVLAGLSSTRRDEILLELLRRDLARRPDPFWIRSLFLHVTQAHGRRESMTDIFEAECERGGEGLRYILTETDPALLAGVEVGRLQSVFDEGAYAHLSACLPGVTGEDVYGLAFDRTSALGLLFLWTVVREEG